MGSVTSGVHTGTEPPVGLGQSPQNTNNNAENLIECHKFHMLFTVQKKNISTCEFQRGTCPTCPLPLPYAPGWTRAILAHSDFTSEFYRLSKSILTMHCLSVPIVHLKFFVCGMFRGILRGKSVIITHH